MAALQGVSLSRRGRSHQGSECSDGGLGGADCQTPGSKQEKEREKPKVPRKTLHRKCHVCPRYDDTDDPFMLLVYKVKESCWWGMPEDLITGETNGNYCGYCRRWFTNSVRGMPHPEGGVYTLERYRVEHNRRIDTTRRARN